MRGEKLRHQLAGHRAHRFGTSSETAEQLQLALEISGIAAAAMTARMKLPDVEEKDEPKRRPIPDHMPRMEVEPNPGADGCADCGGRLRRIGEDVTEELEYVPGRFVVNRIVRPRLTCAGCERFVQAPLPSRAIERGRPGLGLLAHVLVSKYADHLPLYRQSQIFDRDGLDLDRSTLADWVGKTTALLEPLAEAIGRHVLSAGAIFADDTPIRLLAPGTGKTQTARLWTYAGDERRWGGDAPPAARYRFSGDRKGQHPTDHLARYRRWMHADGHADGHAGFGDLYRSGIAVGMHPPVAGRPDSRRSHRQDRATPCRPEEGPTVTTRPPHGTPQSPRRPNLRRSGAMAGHATHHDLPQIPACRSIPFRPHPNGPPAPLSRPQYP
jgi:transposase